MASGGSEGNGGGTTNGKATGRVSLLALRRDAGEVEIIGQDGRPRWATVRQADGAVWDTVTEWAERAETAKRTGAGLRQTREDVLQLYEMVGRCMPDLTPDERRRLTPEQAHSVLQMACVGIERVQEAIAAREEASSASSGNAHDPAAALPPAAAGSPATSSPPTTSSTSAPSSPSAPAPATSAA